MRGSHDGWQGQEPPEADDSRRTLDLQLQYKPATEIDLARFDLWAAHLVADASAGDAATVNGDLFTLDYIRDRILHALPDDDVTRINSALEELQTAVSDEDLPAARSAAEHLRGTIGQLKG